MNCLKGLCGNEKSGGPYLYLLVFKEVKRSKYLFLQVTCSEKCRSKKYLQKRRESEVLESLCRDAVRMDCSFYDQILVVLLSLHDNEAPAPIHLRYGRLLDALCLNGS